MTHAKDDKLARWWAIFPDYRNLERGVLQNTPWEGGSNMTSDFEVISVHHYDALLADLKLAVSALEKISSDKTQTIASRDKEFMDGAHTAFCRAAETADEALDQLRKYK